MDTYFHIIKGMQEDAMSRLNEILPPGKVQDKSVVKMSLNSKKEIDIT